MASGGHNDEGRTPAGYTLYERYALGWLNPEVIEEEGEYKLNALNSSAATSCAPQFRKSSSPSRTDKGMAGTNSSLVMD